MKKINITKEFPSDWITRQAGEMLRLKIMEATKDGTPVEINFDNKIIASTSFFDEGFAKLVLEGWSKKNLDSLIILKNIHKRDKEILDELFTHYSQKDTA